MADSVPPPRRPRLLSEVRRCARALHPAQPQRLSALRDRVRRKAAAHPRGQGRFRGRRLGASGQGRQEGRARRFGVEGGPGNPGRGVAGPRRPRQGLSLPGGRRLGRISRLCEGSGRRPRRGAGRRRADRDSRHPHFAPVAEPAELSAVRLPDHHASAGRRHGQDRRSFCPAVAWLDPLRRESDGHKAGRNRGPRPFRGSLSPAALFRRREPTGASARCRSPF